jgi:hypothetical protein
MNRVRRIIFTVVIATALLMAGAAPAYAHSVSGTGATNFKTTLTKQPTIAGLRVRVVEAGSRFEATFAGSHPVFVLGYQDEPFLRLDRRGVFENLKSPATYINKTRNGTTPPGSANAEATPQWHKISSGHTARWHDHRIHFMGNKNPPQVRSAPGTRHVIVPDWKIQFRQGATLSAAEGSLVWEPGPSPAPYLLLALALLVGLVLIGRRGEPFVAVALAAGALIVIDVVHSLGIGFANAGTTPARIGQAFSASIVSIPGWIVGVGGVWLLLRRRVDGFFAVVFTGLIVAVVGGIADVSVLSRSQVPFAFPASLARPIVAVSLGLGIGIAVASALAIRRLEPSRPASPE